MNNTYDNRGLIGQIEDKQRQLDAAVKTLRKNGTEYAQAKYNYEIEKSKQALEMKSQNMPITLIDLAIRGVPKIATLRMKRDIAEVMYKSNLEAINAVKLEIRILDNQIAREYPANLPD